MTVLSTQTNALTDRDAFISSAKDVQQPYDHSYFDKLLKYKNTRFSNDNAGSYF